MFASGTEPLRAVERGDRELEERQKSGGEQVCFCVSCHRQGVYFPFFVRLFRLGFVCSDWILNPTRMSEIKGRFF